MRIRTCAIWTVLFTMNSTRIILQLFIRPSFINWALSLKSIAVQRARENKRKPQKIKYILKKWNKKKLHEQKVSLSISRHIFFYRRCAYQDGYFCCNNYNLCVPRARMKTKKIPNEYHNNNEPFVLVALSSLQENSSFNRVLHWRLLTSHFPERLLPYNLFTGWAYAYLSLPHHFLFVLSFDIFSCIICLIFGWTVRTTVKGVGKINIYEWRNSI